LTTFTIFNVRNVTAGPRFVYSGIERMPIRIEPRQARPVSLSPEMVVDLRQKGEFVISEQAQSTAQNVETKVYTVQNPSRTTPRVIYDGISRNPIRFAPLETKVLRLSQATADRIRTNISLKLIEGGTLPNGQAHRPVFHAPLQTGKPSIVIEGMLGIGDCLHQRGFISDLMEKYEVSLESPHFLMYHDLIERGLQVYLRDTRLHAQRKTIEREKHLFAQGRPHANLVRRKIGYHKTEIDRFGSITEAIYGMTQLLPPKSQIDFSMPVKQEWRDGMAAYMKEKIGERPDKPILIYRPPTLRREWDGSQRNPDLQAYAAIFNHLTRNDDFFVISIADLAPGKEWIVGPEQDADVKWHAGELDFQTLAALFEAADLIVSSAGFAPVLAQAVGAPCIPVYGGRESYRTTERAGEWLAPTLGIDPDRPCDCHSRAHGCSRCAKAITLPPALERIDAFLKANVLGSEDERGERRAKRRGERDKRFAERTWRDVSRDCAQGNGPAHVPHLRSIPDIRRPFHLPSVPSTDKAAGITEGSEGQKAHEGCESGIPRTLIVGTSYIDNPAREKLTCQQWTRLHVALSPTCDFLMVDTPAEGYAPTWPDLPRFKVFTFPDNVGHLSRNNGKDGWGRAFCYGLDYAVREGYDYVVHIEGDSLFRLPVMPIIEQMKREAIQVASVPVMGMRLGNNANWVETGLMFFSCDYLRRSKFTDRYDWQHRSKTPTPEVIVFMMVRGQLKMMPWNAIRRDKMQFDNTNVLDLDLDWVTHCDTTLHGNVPDYAAWDVFFDANMPKEVMPSGPQPAVLTETKHADNGSLASPQSGMRLNLGCGDNKLPGWSNHDADVDITKPLPWPDNSAAFILAEHVMEHVPLTSATDFLRECHRVLKPGGTVRIAVPSLVRAMERGTQKYFAWVRKKDWKDTPEWAKTADLQGALAALIYCHGHQTAWDVPVLRAVMAAAGFTHSIECPIGQSSHPALCNVEGHGKVITDEYNAIETIVVEAAKGVR
jgi:hypothetical protein